MQGYWLGRCPAHDDSTPSFSIREFEGRPVFRCFSGCSREGIGAALKARGLEIDSGRDAGWETVYAIKDAQGKRIAEHVRVDRAEGKVVFWRPKLSEIGLRVVDLPLYGIELLAGKPSEPVVLTEGEKAADAAKRAGLLALGTVTGAATAPSEAVLSVLAGRKVYLWPDNDDDGREHMARIARTLAKLEIRHALVTWPDAPKKGDAADFFGSGHGLEEFWSLIPRKAGSRLLWEGIKPAISELDKFTMGDFSGRITTGIPKLDRRLRGGMRPGELVLIGAPTGSGKTTLVQQMAVAAARGNGGTVLLVSPEMSLESLAEREIIRESGRPLWDRNPWLGAGPMREACIAEHARAAGRIQQERLSVAILDRASVSMDDIVEAAEETDDLRLVVIDYAQEVANADPNLPRYLQVGEVGGRSIDLASRLKVPVVVASQVNTIKEGRSRTYTFRETAVLEHKASVILILDVDWLEQGGERVVEAAHLVCTKNRSGQTFRLPVHYEPALYRISDVDSIRPVLQQYALSPPAIPA
jgi:energy-coupling factor transporter ATP-binding protein EcfA2